MEQIVAMQLLKLQEIAAAANDGVPVADSVLSVPTWFNDSQRRAMLVSNYEIDDMLESMHRNTLC